MSKTVRGGKCRSYPISEFASMEVTTEKVVDGKWLDFALDMTVEYYKDTDGLSLVEILS